MLQSPTSGGPLPEVPEKVRTLAIVQLVTGIIDVFFGWALATCLWYIGATACTAVTGICTAGMCPIGIVAYLGTFAAFLILPIGLLEIVAGILGLTNPKQIPILPKIASVAGLVGLLFGGLTSAVGGGVAMYLLLDPEVKGFLEGPKEGG